MAIIQALASGPVTFRRSRDLKMLTLRSSAPISAPEIFGGCPAPPPPPPPDPAPEPELLAGYGPRSRKPYPASGGSAWDEAGFLVSTESVEWSPLLCEDGPDVWLDLQPGPVEWSSDADGLQLEARLNWYEDPAPMQHSLWIGLATPDRSTLIALGVQGERGMVGEGFSCLLKINGAIMLSGGNRISDVPTNNASGLGLRLLIQPVSGSIFRAVTLQARNALITDRWETWNPDGSLYGLDPSQWASLMGSFVGGLMRPVLGVTHRAGGPADGTFVNFTRFRFS